jgi:hypothetical protein
MKTLNYFILAALTWALLGCPDKKDKLEAIPDVLVQCSGATLAACKGTRAPARALVGLYAKEVPCAGVFGTLADEKAFEAFFDASGMVDMAVSADMVFGKIGRWRDPSGAPISDLAVGVYKLCGFIDLSTDSHWQPGEPLTEATVETGGTTVILTQWK